MKTYFLGCRPDWVQTGLMQTGLGADWIGADRYGVLDVNLFELICSVVNMNCSIMNNR